MDTAKFRYLQVFAWVLSTVTVTIAFFVWADSVRWRFSNLSTYRIFPLLGLVAFSLMWGHYIVAAVRKHFGIDREAIKTYFAVTSYLVLLAILLHPGLLWWQLWRDGLGLPPESYLENYVAPSLGWVAILGTVSLVIFLAYELHRKFGKRSWWRFVQYASDIAMLAIVYHALRLGTNLQQGWFKGLWFFYGASLVLVLIYNYFPRSRPKVDNQLPNPPQISNNDTTNLGGNGMKNALIVIVVLAVIGGGAFLALSGDKNDNTTTPTTSTTQNDNNTESNPAESDDDTDAEGSVITYTSSGFSPATLTVKAGEEVTVKNDSGSDLEFASDPHPIHTENEELNQGSVNAGQSRTFKLDETGTFGFHNHLNSSHTGTITVQ